ncbi:TPA: hypothetical protein DIS56_01035 [Candidatus Saccharibacteria bacterium]|nr:hypothetical protein [Candidatus Saccharibacteria bacterium]
MSTPEFPTPPESYVAQLEACLEDLQYDAQQIEVHKNRQSQTWSHITELVRRYGVPEEAKFAVAAFSGHTTKPEANKAYVEYLKEIDEQVKMSAGHTVAWLTIEKKYYFHVGLLPQDARLIVGGFGGRLSIPVERSAVVPLRAIYLSDEPLSFENELHPLPTLGNNQVRLEDNPGIDMTMWDKEHPFPLLIGNSAVEDLLNGKLKGYPEIEKALDLLTAKLF